MKIELFVVDGERGRLGVELDSHDEVREAREDMGALVLGRVVGHCLTPGQQV